MLERVWRKGNPLILLVGMKAGTTTMENSVETPLKIGNRTAIWSSNSITGKSTVEFPTEETRIERDSCTPVFIETLFTITRSRKQPRYPSTEERIRKLCYIYAVEYYSAIKKNAIGSVLTRWIKLEPIFIEWSKSERETPTQYINTYIYGI